MILEGVNQGLGRHNDAIQDDDAKVAALMVRGLLHGLLIIVSKS